MPVSDQIAELEQELAVARTNRRRYNTTDQQRIANDYIEELLKGLKVLHSERDKERQIEQASLSGLKALELEKQVAAHGGLQYFKNRYVGGVSSSYTNHGHGNGFQQCVAVVTHREHESLCKKLGLTPRLLLYRCQSSADFRAQIDKQWEVPVCGNHTNYIRNHCNILVYEARLSGLYKTY